MTFSNTACLVLASKRVAWIGESCLGSLARFVGARRYGRARWFPMANNATRRVGSTVYQPAKHPIPITTTLLPPLLSPYLSPLHPQPVPHLAATPSTCSPIDPPRECTYAATGGMQRANCLVDGLFPKLLLGLLPWAELLGYYKVRWTTAVYDPQVATPAPHCPEAAC